MPELVRPRRFPKGTRVFTVLRHLVPAVGLWAIGARRAGGSTSIGDLSRRLRVAAEHLGPTYIKLAQIISSGEGLFPEELVRECKKCRDQVPPESWADVRRVVEEELGRPIDDVFAWIDRTPLASASIAQVHAATLRTGERVVVKVQRPSVATFVHADIAVMAWLAPHLVGRIPDRRARQPAGARRALRRDHHRGARLPPRSAEHARRRAGRSPTSISAATSSRDRIPTLVTRRMLVMERLDGFAFDDVVGMKDAGVDTEEVVRIGMIGFMEGAMLYGLFHGDLHGGNLFVLPDGRVALLDFGITGRMDDFKRLAFLRLLVTASMSDVPGQLEAFRDLGALPPDVDLAAVAHDLGLDGPTLDPTQMTQDEMLHEIQRIIKALLGYGARMPKELMLFVKNMVFLDGAIASLAPDLDLFAEIGRISMYFARDPRRSHRRRRRHRSAHVRPRSRQLQVLGRHRRLGRQPHLSRPAGAARAHPLPHAGRRPPPPPALTSTMAPTRARPLLVLLAVLVLAATACVGSGKTARATDIEPLPDGLSMISDSTSGCRKGESGFDYRYFVIGGTTDLSDNSPLLGALRDKGFMHYSGLPDDLPWTTVAYQHSKYALRAEVGYLNNYLANPIAYTGPDPNSLPADVRAHANEYVLVAMRPTDFGCATPL